MFTSSKHKVIAIMLAAVVLMLVVGGCSDVARAGGGGGQPPGGQVSALDVSGNDSMAYTISVRGLGKASSSPDEANIQLGVESIENDAAEAVSDNTGRMAAVMQSIGELGLEDKDIQTVNYNMWVEQVRDREGNLTGETRYHVVNQISIRLHDLTKTGELLQRALAAGVNNVGGVTFTVSDSIALQREARDLAIADAKAKAEQMATGLGVSLAKVRYVSESSGLPVPGPVFMSEARGMGGDDEVPISAGQFEVTVDVQVIFDINQ